MKNILLLFFISIIFINSLSAETVYKFNTAKDEQRFYLLIKEVRCPKCTSGSLASSNAPVSEDLKRKIAEFINNGKTDEEILTYITQRFGMESSYDPGFSKETSILWLSPIFLLITLVVFFFFRASKE